MPGTMAAMAPATAMAPAAAVTAAAASAAVPAAAPTAAMAGQHGFAGHLALQAGEGRGHGRGLSREAKKCAGSNRNRKYILLHENSLVPFIGTLNI